MGFGMKWTNGDKYLSEAMQKSWVGLAHDNAPSDWKLLDQGGARRFSVMSSAEDAPQVYTTAALRVMHHCDLHDKLQIQLLADVSGPKVPADVSGPKAAETPADKMAKMRENARRNK